jgi:hypothetical protein
MRGTPNLVKIQQTISAFSLKEQSTVVLLTAVRNTSQLDSIAKGTQSCISISNAVFRIVICRYVIVTTNSVEQNPSSEANYFSDSQEKPRILWYPNVHYRIHKK